MKKTLIIILAVVLILVGGIWLYLLLFGTPESADDFFADLGFGGSPSEPTSFVPPPMPEDNFVETVETSIDTTKALNQLSLRAIAGAVVVGTSTDSQTVRYVERGTGQIYEIDLVMNTEDRISEEIITRATEAIWSPDGNSVVVVSGGTSDKRVQLLTKTETDGEVLVGAGFSAVALAPDASQFGFSEDSTELYYLRTDSDGSIGYTYTVADNTSIVRLSVPFIAAAIEWSGTPLIYNRPGENQPGYAYNLVGSSLEAIGSGGESLVAKDFHNLGTVTSVVEEGFLRGRFVIDDTAFGVAIPVIPEKCTVGSKESLVMWCAYPVQQIGNLPTDWYKGTVQVQDYLWSINLNPAGANQGTASLISDLAADSGQLLDVINISTDYTKTKLIFKDKNTNLLWLYDTTVK